MQEHRYYARLLDLMSPALLEQVVSVTTHKLSQRVFLFYHQDGAGAVDCDSDTDGVDSSLSRPPAPAPAPSSMPIGDRMFGVADGHGPGPGRRRSRARSGSRGSGSSGTAPPGTTGRPMAVASQALGTELQALDSGDGSDGGDGDAIAEGIPEGRQGWAQRNPHSRVPLPTRSHSMPFIVACLQAMSFSVFAPKERIQAPEFDVMFWSQVPQSVLVRGRASGG